MSDASRHALYYVKESTYGETPADPTMKRLRHTGTTLAVSKETNLSEELRGDRQIADFRHGTQQIGGDLNFEFSFESFDDMLEAVLMGTWVKALSLKDNATIAANSADDSFQGEALFPNTLRAGDEIVVSGFAETSNNGTFEVAAVDENENKITVVETLTDRAAGEIVSFESKRSVLKAGTTRRSFSFLRHFADQQAGDNPFYLYKGVELNNMNLSLAPGSIATGSFSVLGQSPSVDSSAPDNSTLKNANTNKVFDSFTGSLKENDSTLGINTEIQLTLENGMEPRFVNFSDQTLQPSVGRSNLSGSMSVFFENSALVEKFLDETPSSLDFVITDRDGNSYRFLLPNIVYNGGQPDVSGPGSISLSMPFQAIYDEKEGSQIVIEKIEAATAV